MSAPTETAAPVSSVIPKLTDDETRTINALHRQAQEIVQAVGQTEVRKKKLLDQLQLVEEQAQGIMNSLGQRLGIPMGHPWQITSDGTVVMIDPKTGQPLGQVSAAPPAQQ